MASLSAASVPEKCAGGWTDSAAVSPLDVIVPVVFDPRAMARSVAAHIATEAFPPDVVHIEHLTGHERVGGLHELEIEEGY
jgi:hypothetical protein